MSPLIWAGSVLVVIGAVLAYVAGHLDVRARNRPSWGDAVAYVAAGAIGFGVCLIIVDVGIV